MKRVFAAACAALLAAGIGMACPAAELVGVSGGETAAEEKKEIGERTADALVMELTNATGKDITAFAVRIETDGEDAKDASDGSDANEGFTENLLATDEVFADGETRTVFFAAKAGEDESETGSDAQADAAEETETAEQEGETEDAAEPKEPVLTVRLTFADGAAADFHVFDLEEIGEAELRLEEKLVYLVYEKEGQRISTLDWERLEADEPETEKLAASDDWVVEYDDYYEDTYYDEGDSYDGDAYYDDGAYYDDSADYGGDGGGEAAENCLQGGLMN